MTRLETLIRSSRKLSPSSQRAYLQGVKQFLAFAGEAERHWTPANVEGWVKQLTRLAPQTANKYLVGLKWASRRRHEMDGKRDFAAPVEAIAGNAPTREPRALSVNEVKRLLATCDGSDPITLRDFVILLLGLNMGLRREEMCGLRWQHHHVRMAFLVQLAATLMVRGKGGKEVELQLDSTTAGALHELRRLRMPTVQSHPILLRAKQPMNGKVAGLTPNAINSIVQARARQAGIGLVRAHDLRHTFVSHALAAGVPPWRVQQAARHKRLSTTLGTYTHDPAERGEAEPVGEIVARMRDEPDGGDQ